MLRKLIAIALLAVFGLPLIPSLLAMTPARDTDLPACCRGNGAHHCMRRVPRASTPDATVSAVCPCLSGAAAVVLLHLDACTTPPENLAADGAQNLNTLSVVPTRREATNDHGPQQLRGPPSPIA